MIAHYRIDTQNGDWNKTQPANGIEVRTSALASICLADDDLARSQLCPGTSTSPPQDRMTTNPLSHYASFQGFQAHPAKSRYDEAIISALRETQYDKLMEEEEVIIPSLSPVVHAPTLVEGTDIETSVSKTSPLGPEAADEERVSHCQLRHSEHPGAAEGRRFGTGGEPLRTHRRQGPCCFVTCQGTC